MHSTSIKEHPREEPAMTATTDNKRRELAHRTNNGIEVALFWNETSDRVTIELSDTRLDESIEFNVAGADALDAFYHPYAYAHGRVPPRSAICEAVRR
jgi:hypothetical protein